MKKMMLLSFFIMTVAFLIFNATAMASLVTNKGSTVTMNTMDMMRTSVDLLPAAKDFFVQQNSSVELVLDRSCMMNNSQNLMLEYARKLSTPSSLTVNSIFANYQQIMETCAEVIKIPNFPSMVLNSSDAKLSQTGTKWRQSYDMANIQMDSKILYGANVCTVKKGYLCNFSFGTTFSASGTPIT